jgi:acetyl-CoA carboxylase biotin carboxyl carrier protein
MDLRKLKTLIDLVSDSTVTELEITEGEERVRIVKGGVVSQVLAGSPVSLPAPPAVGSLPAPVVGAAVSDGKQDNKAGDVGLFTDGHIVKSPMVGTFYRAVNPNAKPFVDIGQMVKQGEPLCLVEAMKILNEVESDVSGIVKEVFVQNGQAVEYGQPLFVIEVK